MAVIAGFVLATTPNQPQAIGVVVATRSEVSLYRTIQRVLTINALFRQPEAGTGTAY
jgi:hypothetical protein